MFLWTDVETTGLRVGFDDLLALGIIVTDDQFREVARAEWVIHVPAGYQCMRDMADVVREMHTKSGLLERVADSRLSLVDVEREACAFIDQHVGEPALAIRQRPCMAGNSVAFDWRMIEHYCPRLITRYNYRLLDVSTLKVLAHAKVPGAAEWSKARGEASHTPLRDLEASLAELAHWWNVLTFGRLMEAA